MGKTFNLNLKATKVNNNKIVAMSKKDYALNKFKQIKNDANYNLSQLASITDVHRDIISRYLDGKRINHIDYAKIIKCFPILLETDNTKVNLKPINIVGALTVSGVVRHLYINETRQLYFPEHLQSTFGTNFVALASNHSNNIIVCKLLHSTDCIENCRHTFLEPDSEKNEFFIVTDRNCYYGINLNLDGNWTLCNFLTYKKIDIEPDEKIVEVYQTFVKINKDWTLFLNKNIETKII